MDVNRSLQSIRIFASTAVHQLIATEGAAWRSDQRPEQPELSGSQIEVGTTRFRFHSRSLHPESVQTRGFGEGAL
jgi:hypothetical protein